MIVEHKDLRAFKYCNKGAREFFDRHGLDWSEFVRNGLDSEKFVQTGDHMALKLVEFTRSRRNGW